MDGGSDASYSGGEPTSPGEVSAWVTRQSAAAEAFPRVARGSDEHQRQHGCDVYRSSNAPLLGVLARAAGAKEILEIGCGVGYSALWLAYGFKRIVLAQKHGIGKAELQEKKVRVGRKAKGLSNDACVARSLALVVRPSAHVVASGRSRVANPTTRSPVRFA